jgi:hypothetical protein
MHLKRLNCCWMGEFLDGINVGYCPVIVIPLLGLECVMLSPIFWRERLAHNPKLGRHFVHMSKRDTHSAEWYYMRLIDYFPPDFY